jgi:hypothetical protein
MKTLLSLFVFTLVVGVRADDPSKDSLAAFKEYLAKNYKDKKWQAGPARIDSKELQKAYPNQRFNYVSSSPPVPPGAPLPELLERHRKAMEDYRKNYISLTAMATKDGFQPLVTTADYNRELMQVKNDDDARVAAAAVLSLYSGGGISTGAVIVSADQVKVEKSDKGWTCTASKPSVFQGTVGFNPAGKVISVNKVSLRPLPPSSRPRS